MDSISDGIAIAKQVCETPLALYVFGAGADRDQILSEMESGTVVTGTLGSLPAVPSLNDVGHDRWRLHQRLRLPVRDARGAVRWRWHERHVQFRSYPMSANALQVTVRLDVSGAWRMVFSASRRSRISEPS